MPKFIDVSEKSVCWICKGTGKTCRTVNKRAKSGSMKITKFDILEERCKRCKGTGAVNEDQYHLVYTTKSGQKIAFNVDGIK